MCHVHEEPTLNQSRKKKMLPNRWLQLPTLCARDKEHRLRDRLHFCNSGLKMKRILTKHFSSCGYWKRMILCLGMYQNSILGATLRTHFGAPRLLSQPQPPFLLLLFHRSVFLAAYFIVPTPPQSLDLHMLNNQILSTDWRLGGQTGREARWEWEREWDRNMNLCPRFLFTCPNQDFFNLTFNSPFTSHVFLTSWFFPLQLVSSSLSLDTTELFNAQFFPSVILQWSFYLYLIPLQPLSIPLPK